MNGAAGAGALRFARYAYPPNALGYCGPGDATELFELTAQAADGDGAARAAGTAPGARSRLDAVRGLAALAPRFEGAWPYLQLIAACSGLSDPLDDRVVEAYWVGNRLLDRVPARILLASLRDRFGARLGAELANVAGAVPLGATAHHSFHVFGVYPWLGMLRGGMEGAPLTVLDRCRIRWGRVVAVAGDVLVVRSRGLAFDGHRLLLGEERVEEARHALAPGRVGPGDEVSLHWDWVCDALDAAAGARLRAYTDRTLRAVNAMPVPGPAVACDRRG